MNLSDIKGIGPKRLQLFSELNIRTPEDLLRFYPREYLDYTHIAEIRTLTEGERATVRVSVLSEPTVFYYKGKYIVSVRVADTSGKATLRWMNQPYRASQFHTGDVLFACGTVSKKRGTVMYNPQINRDGGGIVPVYASVNGLTQTVIHDAIGAVIGNCSIPEILPEEWLKRYELIGIREAIEDVHFPKSTEALNRAKRRLSFEEAFLYFTAIRAVKDDRKRRNGYSFRTDHIREAFLSAVPFRPTEAQMRVMDDVETDMRSDRSMNRLIQGDVGSGKTLIAEYAIAIAAHNDKQSAFLAPTELLAVQHFRTVQNRFPEACLLIGSMSKKEKAEAAERIASGEARVVIGTHALLSESVRFSDLGLVITDEQHRFGVLQRAKIEAKGIRPDVLVMSATPIPRTLSLLLYADLDLSVIDTMPPGRKPVRTHYVPNSKRKDLYRHLETSAKNGERSYVVCPLIEPTEGYEGLSLEELYREIKELIPDTKVGFLHGQMPDKEKNAAMEAFRSGETPVIVSTTVVEVGVDVPEATSMVIEGADHFGLATLHQLRGRVGRSDLQSHCYLLSAKPSEHARERIAAMLETNDGFAIAQKDLDMRGSGDLFGVRQSGEGEMSGILTGCTVETIETASAAANEVYTLPSVRYNLLMEEAGKRYKQFESVAHN